MRALRSLRIVRAASFGAALSFVALPGCDGLADPLELRVAGELEREGIFGANDAAVSVDYASTDPRGEWWPCDLRMTALACVGDHHVNVYVSLPEVADLDGVARNGCVVDGRAYGVFELFEHERGGTKKTWNLGTELQAFVVIASDVDDVPGAELTRDDEATAASRIATGTLTVQFFQDLDSRLHVSIEGETTQGRAVDIDFNGPMSAPGNIPVLESPATCVPGALIE